MQTPRFNHLNHSGEINHTGNSKEPPGEDLSDGQSGGSPDEVAESLVSRLPIQSMW